MITDPHKASHVRHKYLDLLGMIWVTFLIIATLTAAKTFDLGPFSFSVAVIAYPITYIFADIFTEVYGYAKTRRIVWTGLICLILASAIPALYAVVPPSESYPNNTAFRSIFLFSPALGIAGVMCFFMGEFANDYVLAKMKVFSEGRMLGFRLIASTLAGQIADSITFYSLCVLLAGIYRIEDLPNLILSTIVFCTAWEILALPFTCRVIKYLKKAEGVDIYDRDTNFNPFHLRTT